MEETAHVMTDASDVNLLYYCNIFSSFAKNPSNQTTLSWQHGGATLKV